jgi:hypothetical protein
MIELIPVLIVDPRKQSIQRLAIENSDVFRSMHELLDLSLIDENGSPSLEVSSLDDRLCAFFAKGTDVRGHREIYTSHWEYSPSRLRFTDLSVIVGMDFNNGGYSGVPIGLLGEIFTTSIQFYKAKSEKTYLPLNEAL